MNTTTKPSKYKIKNKKHQNHRKNATSKHFVASGQLEAKKRTGKFKKKEYETDEKYQNREIVSNLEKYLEKEDEDSIYDKRQRDYENLMNYISKGIQNIYTHHMNPLEKSWETDKITELLENYSSDIFALDTDDLAQDLKFLSIQERLNIDSNILESAMKVSFDSSLSETGIKIQTEKKEEKKEKNALFESVNKMKKEKVIPKDKTTKNEIDELDELLSLGGDTNFEKEIKQEIKKEEPKQLINENQITTKIVEEEKETKDNQPPKEEEENLEDWLDGLL